MSHYICKSINIDEKDGKVWTTGTDNNVFAINPRTGREVRHFRRSEWDYGSRVLREQGRAALEEMIAMNVLDGNIEFYSGKFYEWKSWFWNKVDADSLREKAEYRYEHKPGIDNGEWNLGVERLRKEYWKAYGQRPVEQK
jgi:hypothetical protein